MVTAGYMNSDAHEEFFTHVDAANIDLKAFSEGFYKTYCKGNLKPVLDTLIYVREFTDVWLELTNLIIPTLNDNPKEIKEMCQWVLGNLGADTPLHFSAFHPDYQLKNISKTPPATLTMAREIAMEVGLNFVYTGNVYDVSGDATFCTSCDEVVIQRDWYKIQKNTLQAGRCPKCSILVPGYF
ncbi:MAG: AmmeMemoRadiSam system radical SAM enzyme [SAR324 cluster bacterium]|nr:AmmeMemoRadiSam system radical SAM enzyme [SAR324 cluster bacterium]